MFNLLLVAFSYDYAFRTVFTQIYIRKNIEHSLQFAQKKEDDWKKTHPSEEEEEEAEAEAEVEEDDE